MTIIEREEQLETPSGKMRTLILSPKQEGKFPALVLYSEIFQITGPILRSAKIMAGFGFIVAIPEVYHENLEAGTVLAYDDAGKEVGNDLKIKTEMRSYDEGLDTIIKYLQKQANCSGKFGSIGFCLGGHLAFRAALHPKVSAISSFYGTDIHSSTLGPEQACDTFSRIQDMQSAFLMVWGRQDPHIPEAGRKKIYNELSEREKSFTWHEFNAVHAFMRDEGERYDPGLATQGYQLANQFFTTHLKL